MIAILCASKNSAYHRMDDVEVYDVDRDARTFAGGMPIVAHPPCRAWSQFAANMGHVPIPAERDLGLWCCEKLRECGGVLEQPVGSRLFTAAGLHANPAIWVTTVHQFWWGYPCRKQTWLAFCGIDQANVTVPLRLRGSVGRSAMKAWENMTARRKSETTPEFAAWLVAMARMANENQ